MVVYRGRGGWWVRKETVSRWHGEGKCEVWKTKSRRWRRGGGVEKIIITKRSQLFAASVTTQTTLGNFIKTFGHLTPNRRPVIVVATHFYYLSSVRIAGGILTVYTGDDPRATFTYKRYNSSCPLHIIQL